ncbi:MAG: efflux RND transporter periplasmic adaptor subunit [Rhizobiaceae bacterium]
MAAWKQFILALVILAAAAVGWASFFPGAPAILARWGIDWAQASTEQPQKQASGENSREGGRRSANDQPFVVALPAATATINDRLQAIGTGRAKASVTVNPYATGRLIAITAQSGSHVVSGQEIARLDSDAEEIAVDRAKVAVQDTQSKYDRAKSLRATNTTSAVALTDAEVALSNAKLELRDAELALQRRSIVAPIDGIIGIVPVEVGNYVNAQTTIAMIDDRSSILVDFWVPERFAGAVNVGNDVAATPVANIKESLKGTVSAVDNRIDDKSRTMWVQASFPNPNDSLRAGMSFEVTMAFPGDTYPAVSPLAIQWGAEGAFIWTVDNGKAKRVPVRIIQRNTENVLVDADLPTGTLVVTEGTQSIREGGTVRIAGVEQRQADAGAADD